MKIQSKHTAGFTDATNLKTQVM